ncbi:MAG: preprotein translocase subunit SecA [Candidatus Taylorbacteria bacterium RIFCSPHIGHO2_02_FULL_47_18]|uniref:Protein translocase subunit SecA n=1 Tax=Candidatus Taylorbacteria bacterium RIFCSPLOWO2_01_FULL_48_100 TaxID=1802322 RepID=A0A1G2NFD7_9BACT|nr:MAG: preprotein translocase subunit SecA [Candidatus Taylorbacteria bacterium RIFCSPHIGHO2_02_FULL_47_18]OHA34805.1 MAG: preprotein translocase subunit SecA [Candidatus Taylorbacteria bacterium RIFCSPLOWO2_01_FULL_48_100]OHA45710.1 MAG: preprotein translocase subunit SecA [Candidatus Taylorbacteria bacterium RIFCSPLOWO2_12_FULL_48_11]
MPSFFKGIFGDEGSRVLRGLEPIVAKINVLEKAVKVLPDEAFAVKTGELKKRVADGESLDALLPEAFALAREAARRTLGERHFDVQLLGGAVLHKGNIAEMRTGEGKTLVATLPAYLNALEGKGVHIVTVNDYLSRRDTVWMGQIYNLLGLRVGCINHDTSYIYDPLHLPAQAGKELDEKRDEVGAFKVVHEFLRPCTRREAYEADITYGTNNEFGFDYLRDNLEYTPERLRQKDYNFAIVDEVDSILIDEARTPLIISGQTAESESLYKTFAGIAGRMTAEEDFTIDEKLRAIQLTEKGIEKAEKILGIENLYAEGGVKLVHHLETSVKAKALYRKDKEYVVKNNEVIIVDEFTGRLMPGRRWSEGLHQAVEAKEGVVVQKESRTFASITFQNYFRQYKKLSGMTGTAKTSSEEFFKVYGLTVVEVPTNKEIARRDRNDFIFQTERGKFSALAKKVKELQEKGQPVLVGTVSIEKNEVLSGYFSRAGVKHEVLNAKNHEREGEIIAQAGRRGSVTIATNMAGRGVDIKLGGNPPDTQEAGRVRELGGLFVVGTERHEARRIDNQLRGRSGRQGDPGETQFLVSLEDSLMRIFASDMIKKMMGSFKIPEDEPIENGLINRSLEAAQTKIEGFNFDARKHVLQYDDVLNHQRGIVYGRRRAMLLGNEAAVDAYLAEISAGEDVAEKMIAEKKQALGVEFYPILRRMVLQAIDFFWVEHLETMDHLRGSVNLRAYGQRDPLVEYRTEGMRLFKGMQSSINEHILSVLQGIGAEAVAAPSALSSVNIINNTPKTGRNDPCPCGSGKKFKKCHGAV